MLTTSTSRTSLGHSTFRTPIVHFIRIRGGCSCVGSTAAKEIATFLLCRRSRDRFRRFEFTSHAPGLFSVRRMGWVRCWCRRAPGSSAGAFRRRKGPTTVCSPITTRLRDRRRTHFFGAIFCAEAAARPAGLRRSRKRWQGTLASPGTLKAVIGKSARSLFRLGWNTDSASLLRHN